MTTELTGKHVLIITCSAFAVIIGVNLTLAYKAVATFPGLEVKNSYVASQSFDADRAAQEALGWDVSATLTGREITLDISKGGQPVEARIVSATLGRATHVGQDVTPDFAFDSTYFTAPADLGKGNWNLRLVAEAPNGTLFKQRIIVAVSK